MKKGIIAGLAILAAGAGVVVGIRGGGETEPSVEPSDASVAVVDETRVAVLPACPIPDAREGAKCKQTQRLDDGRCICWTDQKEDQVDNEITATAMAAKPSRDKQRLEVCNLEQVDPKTGKPAGKHVTAQWVNSDAPICGGKDEKGIVAVVDNPLSNVSMSNFETDSERQLRLLCPACASRITAGNWSSCPYCAHPDFPGGCAKACPKMEEKP